MEIPMKSNFFTAKLMTEYKNKLKSTFAEKKLTILNLEELLQYLNQTRLDIYEFRKSAARELRKEEEREENISTVIQNLAPSMCTDIGITYGREAVKRSIKAMESPENPSELPPRGGPSNFDILTLVNDDYKQLNPRSRTPLKDQRFAKIRGFLVTELAECKSQPEVHSVNLICSNISGGGACLMGAYLYRIKRTPSLPQLGLLELGGGFKNVTGLCAYSKFGYLPNLDYLGPHCFKDTGNLPMSVNVSRITEEQILAVVRGTAKIRQFDPTAKEQTIFDILNTHPLCNVSLFESEDEQIGVAKLYSQLYRHMYQVRTLRDYTADALDIPEAVMNIIRYDFKDKVEYYEEKEKKTGRYMSEDEKTTVIRDIVSSKLKDKIADLTDLIDRVQETKESLLERKIDKLREQYDASQDPAEKRKLLITIKDLEDQTAAINRFSGENTPSPESMRSIAATTETEVSARSPSVMSTISEEERKAETAHFRIRKSKAKSIYAKKKSAKKAARKSAKKLTAKRRSAEKIMAKKKTTRVNIPPKVPRFPKAPLISVSPKSMGL